MYSYYSRSYYATQPIEKTIPTGLAHALHFGGSLVTARREPTPKAKNSHALANFSTFSAALASGYALLDDDDDRDEGIDPERNVYRAADGVYVQTKPNLDGRRDEDTADDDFVLRAELFGLEGAWHDDDEAARTNVSLTEISEAEWQPPSVVEPDDRYSLMAASRSVADVAFTDTFRDNVVVRANAAAEAQLRREKAEADRSSQRRGIAPRLRSFFTTSQMVGNAAAAAHADKVAWTQLTDDEEKARLNAPFYPRGCWADRVAKAKAKAASSLSPRPSQRRHANARIVSGR